ncbi:MAG TPA: hypothetical protein VHH13_10915, partial [Arthrobacter sp.]|nr:hypothetical protein [Arthrobacter sp.]
QTGTITNRITVTSPTADPDSGIPNRIAAELHVGNNIGRLFSSEQLGIDIRICLKTENLGVHIRYGIEPVTCDYIQVRFGFQCAVRSNRCLRWVRFRG